MRWPLAREAQWKEQTAAGADEPVFSGLGVITVVLTLIGWSSIPLFLKHFAGLIDPWTANGWRYGISALLWLPVLLWGWHRRNLPRGLWKAALVPSLFNIPGQVCFAIAPYKIDPGLMTFSLRLQIVFVALGAVLLFPGERRVVKHPAFIAGIVLVLGGTMATAALRPGGLGSAETLGVVLSGGAGMLYACYALSVRKCMQGIPPLVAFAAVSQITAAAMVTLMFIFGEQGGATVLALPGEQQVLLVLSSLIGIGLGHTFYFISIARLGVAVASGVVQLQPFLVSAGSLLLFKEKLSSLQWVTGTTAVAGAIVMLVVQKRISDVAKRERALKAFDELPVDEDVAVMEAATDVAPAARR